MYNLFADNRPVNIRKELSGGENNQIDSNFTFLNFFWNMFAVYLNQSNFISNINFTQPN